MKKIYIKPSVSVCFAVLEPILLDGSGGLTRGQNDYGGSCSKKHDFTDDSFDNAAWPKGKSPWED